MNEKDRSDLIPAANESERNWKIVFAADRVAELFVQQRAGARPQIAKIFKEAESTFWRKFIMMGKRYSNG